MFDLIALIKTVGYLGLFGIIFAESGLLVGFFFPGDSLLFTAGFLASQGFLNIWVVVFLCFVGAVSGDSFGYFFGHKVGPKIFTRDDSLFFNKNHLKRAEAFYQKYGAKAIILARFLPLVRTFAPILAGVGQMRYRTFFIFNVIGGMLWAIGIPLAGFYLGSAIPNVDRYLLPIVLFIIFISVLPMITHIAKDPLYRTQIIKGTRDVFKKVFSLF